ncbi:TonB-dependent receptor [uncultured Polaribacter sp.]|uniref:TonB-dependent receptor n=1 Tax=uncultured Polaribacter sp. TaxID=174711 RepID=UPI002630C6F3|nr:TonB-dependent receptor [uncultured Polaribacter sp.]
MKKILFIALVALTQVLTAQSKGTLKGLLTDKETNNEPLPFANVVIKGTTIGTTTDFDGNYVLQVPAGVKIVQFSFLGYKTVEKTITIVAGETITVNQLMAAEEGVGLDEVVVRSTTSKEKTSALVLEQKKAVSIKTTIGAQELAEKGVSDAKGAVAKTAGVSKGSKNVIVRGLGDRYNSTTMNGLPLPAEDPEYKNISLDFFDTSIIKNIGVNKVFSADLSGDVGGANIDIVSKEVTKRREASLGIGLGANSQTINSEFLTIDGTNRFGTQRLNNTVTDLNVYSFQNSFLPNSQNFQLDNSFSFKYGRKYDVGEDNSLSYFLVGNYDAKYNFIEGNIKQNTTDGSVLPFRDQDFSKYEFNVSQLLMGNVKFKAEDFSVEYNHLFIHNNRQSIGDYFGRDNPENDVNGVEDLAFLRRQQTNNNELYVNQLLANYKISDRLDLQAKGAANFVRGNEPDRRTNNYILRDGIYSPDPSSAGTNERFYSKLQENDYAAKVNLSYKLKEDEDDKSTIDFGADYRYTERLFAATIFNHGFLGLTPIDINNPDAVFNQESIDNGVFVMETGRGRNVRVFDPFTYRAKRLISGVYSNIVYEFNENLIVSGGLKFERNHQRVTYDTNIASSRIDGPSEIDRSYVLPSLNIKYNFNDNSIVRFAASQTYTFPQFKEIAPFKYQDVNFSSQGNPDLDPSDNYNFDAKYEYYFSSGELVTVTGFYKYIQNPIARSEIPSGGNTLTYLNVGDDASLYGVELEARKNILKSDETAESEFTLNAGLNMSFLLSEVNLDPNSIAQFQQATSQLEGATPFLMNADITFNQKFENSELTSSVVFNYFSDRVYSIGTRGFENIIEKGIPTLDLVTSLRLSKKYSIKLKGTNLLNPSFQLSRDSSTSGNNVVLSNYKRGVNLSLGFSYDF